MNAPTIRRLLLVLSASLVTPIAFANQCGDVSALLSELGEQYYELDSIPKSELQGYAIKPNNLINTLQSSSFKHGKGTRTRCFGSLNPDTSTPREKVREFTLEFIEPVTINSYNEVVLKAYEYETQTRTSHRETVFIPLSSLDLSLNGDNSLEVNKRHRQTSNSNNIKSGLIINSNLNSSNSLNGTHLREITITATSSYRGVQINQSIYINGHLAEWFTWQLKG